MIPHYLKIAFRSFNRFRTQFLISVLGLTAGFASVAIILLFIDHELNYDQFHIDHERIYRLTDPWGNESGYTRPAICPPLWAEPLSSEFPEIETYVRIDKRLRFNPLLANGSIKFYEHGFIQADSTFFRIFNFKLLSGDAKTALTEPNSIILTQTKARKFFGDEMALGKTLVMDNERAFKVTGVLENLNSQSHLDFNYILPLNALSEFTWVYTYFKLVPGTRLDLLEQKMAPFLKARFKEKYPGQKYEPKFQSVADIHLESKLGYEFKPNGNLNNLYLLGAIGLVILIVSAFNYVNMSVVMASMRSKEFGLRKTFGSSRNQSVSQSMSESVLLCFIAFIFATFLSYLLYPDFSELLQRNFSWSDFTWKYLPYGIGLSILIGISSGAYPAFILSALKPADALRGKFSASRGGILRNSLMTIQFAVSIVLIAGSVVMYLQLRHLKTKDLGFDREQVLVVNGRTSEGIENVAHTLKSKIESLPEVKKVSFSQTVPGDYSNMANIGYKFEGVEEDRVGSRTIFVSHDFIETLGISLVEGRSFSKDFKSDSAAYIINEACAKMVGWGDPIGKTIKMTTINKMEGNVIGVMKDFHFASLHSEIEPLILMILPQSFQKVLIRIDVGDGTQKAIDKIALQWREVLPEYPFEYQFLDQQFNGLYGADEKFSDVFEVFTAVAIVLTCIGLYSMVSFDIRRRLKEVGIRKVAGASIAQIMLTLSKNNFKLMIVGVLIGIPVSWIVLDDWLSNFAYSISISLWTYLLSFVLLVLTGIITIGYKVFSAARTNPVDVLRNE